ncbi:MULTISPECIES: cold-shock protein [Pedobacter]|uniref:cold-shock protein n=1 Tax=Pedobacter TaxID=84567 RepID=UPI00064A68AB|nr:MULTISPECIES: cold shock domain-containing protein [Pedobacter]KLT67341.1 hypothetical protein AB669_01120 [Pedobacter sp. BMA]
MRLGTVKSYDPQSGHGHITPSDGGRELNVFAHGVLDEIHPNSIVQFDIEFTKQGVEAVQVKLLSS